MMILLAHVSVVGAVCTIDLLVYVMNDTSSLFGFMSLVRHNLSL